MQQLCSVSIQPPSSYLTTLVQSYSTCNTRIPVLDHDTNVAQFITEIVATRILPDLLDNTTPVVVINIDMERVEQIVPAMLVTGVLGHVDSAHLELRGDHTEGGDRVAQDITALDNACWVSVLHLAAPISLLVFNPIESEGVSMIYSEVVSQQTVPQFVTLDLLFDYNPTSSSYLPAKLFLLVLNTSSMEVPNFYKTEMSSSSILTEVPIQEFQHQIYLESLQE